MSSWPRVVTYAKLSNAQPVTSALSERVMESSAGRDKRAVPGVLTKFPRFAIGSGVSRVGDGIRQWSRFDGMMCGQRGHCEARSKPSNEPSKCEYLDWPLGKRCGCVEGGDGDRYRSG
jgi:hypothetical protein